MECHFEKQTDINKRLQWNNKIKKIIFETLAIIFTAKKYTVLFRYVIYSFEIWNVIETMSTAKNKAWTLRWINKNLKEKVSFNVKFQLTYTTGGLKFNWWSHGLELLWLFIREIMKLITERNDRTGLVFVSRYNF